MESEAVYIIIRSNTIIGDSRTILKGSAVNLSLVELCRAADLHEGKNVEMTTYLPVETYADRDTVYEVYRTEGIPVLDSGYSPDGVAMGRSQGTFMGHVQCIQALWD